MHNTSNKYLLQIEPKSKRSALPTSDALSMKMELLLSQASKGRGYKGTHKCICGKRSENYDLSIEGYITNSLAVHYLLWHRDEVPRSEIIKLRLIKQYKGEKK